MSIFKHERRTNKRKVKQLRIVVTKKIKHALSIRHCASITAIETSTYNEKNNVKHRVRIVKNSWLHYAHEISLNNSQNMRAYFFLSSAGCSSPFHHYPFCVYSLIYFPCIVCDPFETLTPIPFFVFGIPFRFHSSTIWSLTDMNGYAQYNGVSVCFSIASSKTVPKYY